MLSFSLETWVRLLTGASLGLIFGSFLTVIIPRLHANEGGIVMGRSHCKDCKKNLSALELIPVLSYLWQGGKCRHCKNPIPQFHLLLELSTAILFTALWWKEGEWTSALLLSPIFLSLAFIFFYDLLYKEVHDIVLIPAIAYSAALSLYYHQAPEAALGALIGGGFFGLQYLLSKGRWVGSGDILIGLFLGFFLTDRQIPLALLAGYSMGSIVGIALLLSKKATAKTQLPLGPFLVMGTLIVYFI